MELKFSVVVPIHNEAKYLPYSLPAIYSLVPDEVILIFDRCTDESIEISKNIAQKFGNKSETRYIELNDLALDWKFRIAFLRRYGYRLANNDIILNTDADIILDKKVKNYIPKIGKNGIGLISFSYHDYPITIQHFIRKLMSAKYGFSGQYAFSKEAWLKTEDEESVKNIITAEDSYLRKSISRRYKRLHIQTKSIHLRPGRTKTRNYMRGIVRWKDYKKSLRNTVINSIIYLRPATIVGYLHARRQDRTHSSA